MFLGLGLALPRGGIVGPWSGYSSALAALLTEAQTSGLVLDFTQNLAFRAGTSSTIAGVSGWTYTRTGTAYDLAGTTSFGANVPRRTSAGLLVEAGATNSCLWSNDLGTSPWVTGAGGQAVVTQNAGIAPDGSLTATQLDDQSTAQIQGRQQPIVITSSSNSHTSSTFMRAGTSSVASLRVSLVNGTTGVAGEVIVDLTNGNAQWRAGAAGTSFVVTPVGGGWYRVVLTVTDNASGNTQLSVEARPAFAPTYTNTPDILATGTAFFWGAQVELNQAFATSYIPTTTTTASRGADAASVTFTQALPYSVVAEFFLPSPTGSARIVGVNGTANTALQIQSTTSVSNFNGSGAVTSPSSSSMANRIVRAGSAHATGDLAITLDGLSPSTGTFNNADLTSVNLGSQGGTSNFMNGNLRLLAILPRRITNTELQGATA